MHNARKGHLGTVAFQFGLDCHQMSLAQEKTFIFFLFYKMATSRARDKGHLATVGI